MRFFLSVIVFALPALGFAKNVCVVSGIAVLTNGMTSEGHETIESESDNIEFESFSGIKITYDLSKGFVLTADTPKDVRVMASSQSLQLSKTYNDGAVSARSIVCGQKL